jgi:hypothetical protein
MSRAFVLLACVTAAAACQRPDPADLVLSGGHVVTMDAARPTAEAVAVRGDRIVAVGSDADIEQFVGPSTERLALDGRTVVPGLIDAHVHFVGIGSRKLALDARGRTKAAVVAEVAERVARAAPGEWIQGRGWDHTLWEGQQFPTRADLDAVAPDHPVYLGRVDGHAGWANSRALALAGIDRGTPDPAGGQILRDARGEPTGTLIDNAFRLVTRLIPPLSREQRLEAIRLSIEECLSVGLTSVHEAGGFDEDIELYQQLMREGRFDLRIYEFLRWPVNEQQRPHSYDSLDAYLVKGPQIGLHDHRLTIRGIKMSIDGALGSRGAAFLEPYADDPGNTGLLRLTADEVFSTIVRGLKAGFQTTTHAIGDRANRLVLDAMEKALGAVPTSDHRLRIEHAQVLTADDLPRFARLGIIASMQPSHATTDMRWAGDRVGADRLRYAYAWASLLDSGARIAGGSDAPVEPVAPLQGIYAAVTRQDFQGWPDGGWQPAERVSREQALRMFTLDAAYSVFEESLKGSIETGKLADMVVLSKDIMTIPAPEILTTEVERTILGGRVVYSASSRTSPSSR